MQEGRRSVEKMSLWNSVTHWSVFGQQWSCGGQCGGCGGQRGVCGGQPGGHVRTWTHQSPTGTPTGTPLLVE